MDGAVEPAGYHPVTKLLHWTMFVALVAQFVVGYAIDRADGRLEHVVGGEGRLIAIHVAFGYATISWPRTWGTSAWS